LRTTTGSGRPNYELPEVSGVTTQVIEVFIRNIRSTSRPTTIVKLGPVFRAIRPINIIG